MNDFSGKRILVTGGANGLGLAIVRKFHAAKGTVIALDINAEKLAELKKELPDVITVQADLTSWDDSRKAVEAVGPIDHLVNNAGVGARASFLEMSEKHIGFVFDVNFKPIVNLSQVVAKGMIARGTGGTIVNISSVLGESALDGCSMYSASKAAVNMLTKSMALELGSNNIRVNAVCPQCMITDMTRDSIARFPEKWNEIIERQCIRRFLTPEETADSVLFLSSPASAMITGVALKVDAGFTAH